MRRRQLLGLLGSATTLTAGCVGDTPTTEPAFVVSSPAFESGDRLPAQFTCEGAGDSPPFTVEKVPEPTAALAVDAEWDRGVIDEPRFWTVWNIPPDTTEIPAGLPREKTVEALDGARQGRKPDMPVGYEPPCPPRGRDFEHRFQVYALEAPLDLPGGTSHGDVVEAIDRVELASTRFTVTYGRPVDTADDTSERS